MARRLLGSAGDTALRNLTQHKNGAPVSDTRQNLDKALDLLYDECDHYLDPISIVRDGVAELRADNERLRGIEQRAREVAEWPDGPDFRGPYVNAGIYILGEEAGA